MNPIHIHVIGIEGELEDTLRTKFDKITPYHRMDELPTEQETVTDEDGLSVLVLSDQSVGHDDITNVPKQHYDYAFYLMTNSYDKPIEKNLRGVCHAQGIEVIPPRLVDEQIAQRIEKTVNPNGDKETNVASFFSVSSNIGTTSLTINTAYALAKHSEARIGVLLLNAWDSGAVLLPEYEGSHLNEIKGKLANQLLNSDDEFESIFHVYNKNMYVLAGNLNPRYERLYTKEEIHYLIERAKDFFDMVIIDAGSHFDNAPMIQVLEESSYKYLVSTQQPKVLKRWQSMFHHVLDPLNYKPNEFMLVLNQYEADNSLQHETDIQKMFETMLLTSVPKSPYGSIVEGDQQFLYDYEDEKFNEKLHNIVRAIAGANNIDLNIPETKQKRGIFSLSR